MYGRTNINTGMSEAVQDMQIYTSRQYVK